MLKRQGLIETWHDRRMLAGDHLDWTISAELDAADVVLLLLSPDFLASDYCYRIEKGRALIRHRQGTARLISVILRPCDWTHTDLAGFIMTPKDGKAITTWPNRDEAFLDATKSIR
ncbi:MAG: toll/interleukin-1 receptor domain-containing protein [Rhodobacteraceae bacterium]|nr:toll/interleukin-1 receptor domain-containing protein [Paracoccaceae bacterium]